MVKKNLSQLRREIKSLKKKDRAKSLKINRAAKEQRERKELEGELKELKRSGAYKKLRKFSKQKLSKEELKKGGKATAKSVKTAWNTLGKIVNKLDKINL